MGLHDQADAERGSGGDTSLEPQKTLSEVKIITAVGFGHRFSLYWTRSIHTIR